ncbi:hypothetical protein GW17_00040425 [Ensete ventricosum]|nr:hypothetical protein GW17_00040425 [Ensete ventricosum]
MNAKDHLYACIQESKCPQALHISFPFFKFGVRISISNCLPFDNKKLDTITPNKSKDEDIVKDLPPSRKRRKKLEEEEEGYYEKRLGQRWCLVVVCSEAVVCLEVEITLRSEEARKEVLKAKRPKRENFMIKGIRNLKFACEWIRQVDHSPN